MTNCFRAYLIVVAALVSTASANEPPNVVVILADDLGWGAVSYHSTGDTWVETPNIDKLVREGIELDRFYVAPMCSPTRAGLLTGRYPIRFGLARAVIPPQRDFGLPVEETTMAKMLGEAGYVHRGIFGKWHLGHHQTKWHPLARGFTHFEGHYNGAIDYFDLTREGERDWHEGYEPSDKQGYATDLIASAAVDFIQTAAANDAPYFCYVPFNAPHSPFQAKAEDIRRYGRVPTAGEGKATTGQMKKGGNEDVYRAMVWSMDEGIGRILEAIEKTGESQNTQVWFFSDNGGVGKFKKNNQPLHGSKLTTFEGGVRVPACVRWPARWEGGRKIESTIGYIDVLPTILDSAKLEMDTSSDRPIDGVSLDRLFSGTADDFSERDWYSYHGQSGADEEKIAIKTAQWKLVVNGPDVRGGVKDEHDIHLYRMPGDLVERRDVSEQYPEVVTGLFSKLVAYRSLQPENAIAVYSQGKNGFKPWKDWRVEAPK